jgi:hypothetical protein
MQQAEIDKANLEMKTASLPNNYFPVPVHVQDMAFDKF